MHSIQLTYAFLIKLKYTFKIGSDLLIIYILCYKNNSIYCIQNECYIKMNIYFKIRFDLILDTFQSKSLK